MATIINNQNDENEKNETNQPQASNSSVDAFNASNAAPTSAASGVLKPASQQTGSGRFTNLQSYLGANKQAGTQIANKINKGITGQLNQGQATAGREVSEANQANQQAQQINQNTQNYLNQVSAPVTNQNPTIESGGFLASQYTNNYGPKQEAIMNIASDANKLNEFTGLRQGTTQQDQAQKSLVQTQEASNAANKVQNDLSGRQKQLASETGRTGLLSEFVANPNRYSGGTKALDQSFLQRDSNNVLDTLKTGINAYNPQVTQNVKAAQDAEALRQSQLTAGQELAKQLDTTSTGNVNELQTNLTSRQQMLNEARNARLAELQNQFGQLGSTGEISQDFANMLGLGGGERLLSTLDNTQLGDIVNVGSLQQQANNITDAANQKDFDYGQALAALAGQQNILSGTSGLTDATSNYAQNLRDAMTAFNENAKNTNIQGQGSQDWNWRRGTLFGQDIDKRSGTESATASANLADYLNGINNISTSGQGPTFGVGGNSTSINPIDLASRIIGGFVGGDETGGRRYEAYGRAKENAKANLAQNLQDYLNKSGYNKTVKIKG